MSNFEVTDFEKDVLERSESIPTLVDFWAPWCRPCLALGPILEEVYAGSAGRWALVKVNTEDRPELAHRFKIAGIPSLKLFFNREIVSEKQGVLPKLALTQWLDEFLPNPNQTGLDAAQQALETGDYESCETIVRELLESDPVNHPARLLLAQTLWSQAPQEALSALAPIQPDSDSYQTAEALRFLLGELDTLSEDGGNGLPESPGKAMWVSGLKSLGNRLWEPAFQSWIEGLEKDRSYREECFKNSLKNLFILLGVRHPIASKYHRAFTSALYS